MPSIKVFGKLYLAGEYAIVDRSSPAIVLRTPQAMTFEWKDDLNIVLQSEKWGTLHFDWQDDFESLKVYPYVCQAFTIIKRLLLAKHIKLKGISLTIRSELDHPTHQKYGLGSSGAFTVGLLETLLIHHGVEISSEMLYKLAVLCQWDHMDTSSFGDLACAAYKHSVYYEKFDVSWLRLQNQTQISSLIQKAWTGLVIERLAPLSLPLCAVYSNQSADSHQLVKAMQPHRTSKVYAEYVNSLRFHIPQLKETIDNPNPALFLTSIDALNQSFDKLSTHSGLELVTLNMRRIAQIIQTYEGHWKVSGAGGGDCVICFFSNKAQCSNARVHLARAGFESFMLGDVHES